MAQVDGDRNHDAEHLQHQQDPVGKRTRIDQDAHGKQHRGQRDTVERQGNRHFCCPPCHHRCRQGNEQGQNRVEEPRRVGREPPEQHQCNQQGGGERSPVGALDRLDDQGRASGEEPGGQYQNGEEQPDKPRSVLHQVVPLHLPGRSQLGTDAFEFCRWRAETPYRGVLQRHPLRIDAFLPCDDQRPCIFETRLQNQRAVQDEQHAVAKLPDARIRVFKPGLDRSRALQHCRGNTLALQKLCPLLPIPGARFEQLAIVFQAPDDAGEVFADSLGLAVQAPQVTIQFDRIDQLWPVHRTCAERVEFPFQGRNVLRKPSPLPGLFKASERRAMQIFAGDGLLDGVGHGRGGHAGAWLCRAGACLRADDSRHECQCRRQHDHQRPTHDGPTCRQLCQSRGGPSDSLRTDAATPPQRRASGPHPPEGARSWSASS